MAATTNKQLRLVVEAKLGRALPRSQKARFKELVVEELCGPLVASPLPPPSSSAAPSSAAASSSSSAVRHAKHEILAAQQRAAKQVKAAEDRATRAEQAATAATTAAAAATTAAAATSAGGGGGGGAEADKWKARAEKCRAVAEHAKALLEERDGQLEAALTAAAAGAAAKTTAEGRASAAEGEAASALAKVEAAKQESAAAVRQVKAAQDRATRAEQATAAAATAAAAASTPPVDAPGYALLDFESSHFKCEYARQRAPRYPGALIEAVAAVVHGYCGARGITDDAAHAFVGKLLEEHKEQLGVGEMAVALTAQQLWTSTDVVEGGPEFCTMYSAVLREDRASLAAAAATLARALNTNLVWPGDNELPFPGGARAPGHNKSTAKGKCFRGGGFRDTPATRAFFEAKKKKSKAGSKFRVAQFLATSFSRPAAERFVMRAADTLGAGGDGRANATVLWTIELDGIQRCLHVNRLTETHVEEEAEFLFAAFSVFSVVKAVWSDTPTDALTPHQITIRAAVDNAEEREDLPLAPWC
jgi:hypothetical protein